MPSIVVTYKKKALSRRQIAALANVLFSRACRKDLIWSENLNVYMREVGKFDRQYGDVIVHIAADSRYHCTTFEEEMHIKNEITKIVLELAPLSGVFVEVMGASAAAALA